MLLFVIAIFENAIAKERAIKKRSKEQELAIKAIKIKNCTKIIFEKEQINITLKKSYYCSTDIIFADSSQTQMKIIPF